MNLNLYFPLNRNEIRKVNLQIIYTSKPTEKYHGMFKHLCRANLGYMMGSYEMGFNPPLVNFPFPIKLPLGALLYYPKKKKQANKLMLC